MADGIKVRVLFFAGARELVKSREQVIRIQSTTTGKQLLSEILEQFPVLKPLEYSLILAHNQNYLDLSREGEITVGENDEIAVIPPISSGESNSNFTLILNLLSVFTRVRRIWTETESNGENYSFLSQLI